MAVWRDRVWQTTTTTGTGTIALGPAAGNSYQTIAGAGYADGDAVKYDITAVDSSGDPTGVWEVGTGTVGGSGTTLARTTVEANSSGTTSPLSLAAGTKRVMVTPTAAWLASLLINSNNLSDLSSASTARTNLGLGTAATQASSAFDAAGAAASALTSAQAYTTGALAAFTGSSNITTVGTLAAGSIPYSLVTGGPSAVTGADPTGSVGLSAVNGSAATFLRSDGAPALSQSISPTWTNPHIFTGTYSHLATVGGVYPGYVGSTPTLMLSNGTAAQNVRLDNVSGSFRVVINGQAPLQMTDTTITIGAANLGVSGNLTAGGRLIANNGTVQATWRGTSPNNDLYAEPNHYIDRFNGGGYGGSAAGDGFGSWLLWRLTDSALNVRYVATDEVILATATSASFKARRTFKVADVNANRECLRIEASGSAAMIGFLGAAAVARQTVSAASTDLTTVVALANDIRTALINLGLCV